MSEFVSMGDVADELITVNDGMAESYGALLMAAATLNEAHASYAATRGSLGSESNTGSSLEETTAGLAAAHSKTLETIVGIANASSAIQTVVHNMSDRHFDVIGDIVPDGLSSPVVATEQARSRHQSQVTAISQGLNSNINGEQLPNYYARGGYLDVFNVAGDDGKLIKMPRPESSDPDDTFYEDEEREPDDDLTPNETMLKHYVEPLMRAQGLPGFEQIEEFIPATDKTLPVVIVRKVNGTLFDKLSNEELDAIPESHYNQLLQLYEVALANGIMPDVAAHNVMYNPDTGFTLIDFGLTSDDTINNAAAIGEGFFRSIGLLSNWQPGTPFPEAGRRYMHAYRQKFGDDAGAGVKERLKAHYVTFIKFIEVETLRFQMIYKSLPDAPLYTASHTAQPR